MPDWISSGVCNDQSLGANISTIKITYFNARSLRNKLHSFYNVLYSSRFDIICVTESWLDLNFSNGLLDPKGYFNIYRFDRTCDHPAGGVCILVNRNIDSANIDMHADCVLVELVALSIFVNAQLAFTLVCCYIAPSVSRDFFNNTIKCMRNICTTCASCILVGDFNLPNIDWLSNNFPGDFKSQLFLTFFTDFGFFQYISECTRKSKILDLLCCNDPLILSEYSIGVPFHNSDHECIEFTVAVEDAKLHNSEFFPKYVWRKTDWDSFDNFLSTTDWDTFLPSGATVDDHWHRLSSILSQGIDSFVPTATTKSNCNVYHSGIVKKLISKRKTLWRIKRSSLLVKDNDKYKAVTTALNDALVHEAASKELNIIKSGNLGQFYKHVNSRLNHKTGIAPLSNQDGSLCISDSGKSEMFSVYFASVGIIDDGYLPDTGNDCLPVVSHLDTIIDIPATALQSCSSTLESVDINFDSVSKAISGLNGNAAAGPDNIPPILLKKLAPILIFPLTFLFSAIIESGVVPNAWKIATVTPIFKKGASSKVSNYRPISLTSTSCKLFESVLKLHLLNFLNFNKIITPAQHGFLQGHSTCTNLLEAVSDLSMGLDKSLSTLILYVDFAKAFDCVSVPKLMYKLRLIGITGNLLSVLASLLNNRSQRVRVGSAFSSLRPVLSGVPQGSVLGPILFLIFINDLESCLPPSSVTKFFADDAKSYVRVLSDSSIKEFRLLISNIEMWSKKWQLPLAVDKCCWMFLSNRSNSLIKHNLNFTLSGVDLAESYKVNDLGVLFDSSLKFSSHIDAILAKAKQRLYLLKKSFSSSDDRALILAFKIYVIPLLEYCSPVWSPCMVTDILRIESVQRTFTKTLKLCSSLSYKDRLLKCNLCSLERRRIIADLTLLYKISKNIVAVNLCESIKPLISITRGHTRRYKIPRARINTTLHVFANRTIKVWNCLSEETVSSDSVFSFKRSVLIEDLSKFLVIGF